MTTSKSFKLVSGLMQVVAVTVYSQTADHMHAAVVFFMAGAIFLVGYFAGEDI